MNFARGGVREHERAVSIADDHRDRQQIENTFQQAATLPAARAPHITPAGDSTLLHDRVNRWADWWHQAEHDLAHAASATRGGHFDWAAFAAHQAAEKAAKALIYGSGQAVATLLRTLPQRPDQSTIESALRLDKHYIPSRYPNGLPDAHPGATSRQEKRKPRSPMQKRSSASAGAIYLDRDARMRDIEAMACRAAKRLPQIRRRIILFGSMMNGIPTPRSDADLLVESTTPIDRTEVLEAMQPLACGVDLFVHVAGAEEALVVRTARRTGRDLLA